MACQIERFEQGFEGWNQRQAASCCAVGGKFATLMPSPVNDIRVPEVLDCGNLRMAWEDARVTRKVKVWANIDCIV